MSVVAKQNVVIMKLKLYILNIYSDEWVLDWMA